MDANTATGETPDGDDRTEVFGNVGIEDIYLHRIEEWFSGLVLEKGDRIIIKNSSGCKIAHAYIK